ncbi:MAG: MBL fold metallo-hydrolase [Candidatus Thorarchaeota archaeon]|jgi:ribonuclease BN (tRNA processing enzyme)
MGTKVILLGTGTPNMDPKASGPSTAIIIDESVYIVDFGPGVVRRAAEVGVKASQLSKAFLTHLHSDHTAGYPDLILTPAVVGRKVGLEVYGPEGLQAMTDHILAAYESDIQGRINGPEPAIPEAYIVKCHEFKDSTQGIVYQDDNVSVEAFPVIHGPWSAYGFKFVTEDKTVVVSGDTAPTPTVIEKARGCDVLIHEVYSAAELRKRSPEWIAYFTSMHTSTRELAEIATQARPKQLVLYHQIQGSKSDQELLSEIQEIYDGKVISGKDLDIF